MPESYDNFRAKTLKLTGEKKFKVTNSYGTKQGWRWLRKNKWLDIGQAVTERQFGEIIKGVNKILVGRLLKGLDAKFPNRMGKLELRKYFPQVKFENSQCITNLPIDWKRTLHLWHEDPQCRKDKYLVRKETDEIFKVLYNKRHAVYKNKKYYQFSLARAVKLELKNTAENNRLDAFLL